MSWDDDSFDPDEDPRKMLRKWFGDFLPEEAFRQIEEMMDQMMRQFGEGAFIDPSKLQEAFLWVCAGWTAGTWT